MKYLLTLYQDENAWEAQTDEQKGEIFGAYFAYNEALKKADAYIGGEPLDHSSKWKRARASNVQDGPFADAKEQLGGYYLIDVDNLDEALDWAARCPCASFGHVEVRPTWDPSA